MRSYLLLFSLTLLVACSTVDKAGKPASAADQAQTAAALPSGLEGPAYDPSKSPVPMTASTVLPKPPGSEITATVEGPSAYGQTSAVPSAYGTAPTQEAKSGAAPTTYQQMSAQDPAPAAVANNLAGLWVNTADEQEVVEFTTDHYATYYEGQLLVQEPMTYHSTCPAECNNGEALDIACFSISGPAGTDCYGIIRLTPEILELSMLGVSTETIVYRKQ